MDKERRGIVLSSIHVAKTKALFSFAVTAKLISAFVFAYAKCMFSHDKAQMVITKARKILQLKDAKGWNDHGILYTMMTDKTSFLFNDIM